MAVRLPVVLCQHERRTGKFAEHEEQWITSLLFEDRLDATLVSDLALIKTDSTDHLCLEGLRGEFVLVSWQTKESVAEQLARLGFPAFELVPLDGSEKLVTGDATTSHVKKVYFLPFDLGRNLDGGLGLIKNLLASRSTPVFQLNSSLSKDKPKAAVGVLPVINSPANSSPIVNSPSSTHTNSSTPASESKARAVASSSFAPQPSMSAQSSLGSNDDEDFPHIDSLMNDLDKFDI